VHAKLDTLKLWDIAAQAKSFQWRMACTNSARVIASLAPAALMPTMPRSTLFAHLAVRIPPQVSSAAASLTTIGAIGHARSSAGRAGIGETVAVIGAGLVGVLTIQILRAAGCRVVAIDLSAQRVKQAAEHGAHLALPR